MLSKVIKKMTEQKYTLIFEAPLGDRVHRYFDSVTTYTGLWWDQDNRCWDELKNIEGHASMHAPCNTLKAFRRMLRKHPNIAEDCVLVNKYIGYDVYCTTRGE